MCALLLIGNVSFAQKRIELSHPLRKIMNSGQIQSNIIAPRDTVRILAIMVEFQTDADDQTTGNGKFQSISTAATDILIDPPPHDSLYFKNKIQFVENYFHKVSNGKLTVTGAVYGDSRRITLSKQMKSYSPPTNTNDNSNLADLARESWQIADSLYPEIDFQKYDAFVIFHAGTGRDLDLVSSIGYNPTPYDIPSLYFDSTAFAVAIGQSSFPGFLNGIIKNTIILPETESRDLPVNSGTQLYQFSINGMFAASVGSYLGLPDLFDTKTGGSGIGQFGLMDGAAIFAYNGLFPPEPSAWEKMYLGWLIPITIGSSSTNLSVPAVGLKYPTKQDTVYKIPITSSEYFLVENRNRNPKSNGLDIKIANAKGDTLWRHFSQDTDCFRYYDVSGINGSIVDVSNYDWAIIGETDGTGKYDGGGILIWHIDENMIQAGLSTNSVNANLDHRGVDLEEADGSKDIGQSYASLTAGSGTENGSPLDCWFNGNSAIPYKNIFDQSSFPNSNSFSGAASLVTIRNFSLRSPRMTMTVDIGNQILLRDSLMHREFKNTNVTSFPTSTKNHLYLPTNNGIYALYNNGQSLLGPTDLLTLSATSNGVAVNVLPDSTEIVASVQDSVLRIFKFSFHGGQSSIDSSRKTYTHRFTTSPCFAQLDSLSLLVGAETGTIYQFDTNGDTISKRSVGTDPVSSITLLSLSSSTKPNEYFFTSGNKICGENSIADLPASPNSWILAAAVSTKGNYIIAAENNGNRIISYNQSLSQKNFEISISGSGIRELAIADIDGDGEKDVVVQSANSLSVINRIGSMLDGFPIQTRTGLEFTGTPLIVDFNGDAKQEIVLLTNDGEMWVYDRNGKMLSGFPVQITSPGKAFPMAYTNISNKLSIAVLSETGSFDAYLTSSSVTSTSLTWWQHLCDERHSNMNASVTQQVIPISTEFFPKSHVYNWPNPVYGQSTQIRYFTNEDASVTITILDLSGRKITELSGRGTAGMDNEVTWNVSNIQSGVYLARVEARGANKSEIVFIKIAVVK
jgi:hypothetical protein